MSGAKLRQLADESGTGSSGWVTFGMAAILLLSMTALETMIYRITGCGFLVP